MSYRRTVFEEQRFDESMVDYALGEDAEFSYRVRQWHPLLAVPEARIDHRHSSTNRWHPRRRIRTELAYRYVRVRSRVGGLRTWAFWWSAFGLVVLRSASWVTSPSRESWRRLSWAVGAVGSVARHRPSTYEAARRVAEPD
jgi:GT2 family glycosyltransferase